MALVPMVWAGCVTPIGDVEKGSRASGGTSSGGVGGGGNSGGDGGSGATGGSGGSGGTGGSGATGGSTDGGTSDAPSGGTGGVPPDGSGLGGLAGAGTAEILAEVADCIDTTNPNPDQCESVMGKYQMVVDLENSAMIGGSGAGGGPATAVFVRFNLGQELAKKTISDVELQMTITDYTNSYSTMSGEVYQVSTFTRLQLFSQTPAKIGGVIGVDQGQNDTLETVTWTLPESIAQQPTVCLGVFPINNNGAYYYNALGATPPRLRVVYQ